MIFFVVTKLANTSFTWSGLEILHVGVVAYQTGHDTIFHDYIPVPSISQVTANLAAKYPFPRRESHDGLLCYGLSGEKNSAYNHTFEYCSDESHFLFLLLYKIVLCRENIPPFFTPGF